MDFLVGAGERVTVAVGCMIETPHTLHTHSRSTLNIYKVFQNLRHCPQAGSLFPTFVLTLCNM